MPKVSVLIPAYNVEPYIEACIGSVLAQTLQDFEIICVDDCSTDRTLDVLRRLEAEDNRIRVYTHERNLGQAAGRNHALSHATGEYVYMLDADDEIVPEALRELYDICERDRLDVVGFETENFSDDPAFVKNVGIKTLTYDNTEVLDGRGALCYCMESESFSLSTPTFMMRRAYLTENEILFYEGILHEDVGYILELITRAERMRFLHRVYFRRRIRANSTMTVGFTDRNIEGYLKSFYNSFALEKKLAPYLERDAAFEKAFRKWQREIFGRVNRLYEENADHIKELPGGHVDEEIRRAFSMIKLSHYRTKKFPFTKCYLCGTGQYTERAIEAVGARDVIIAGVLVLEKNGAAFHGFPQLLITEADANIPIVLSVSGYHAEEYKKAFREHGLKDIFTMEF